MIILKSASEIDCMRKAGRIVAKTLSTLRDAIRPGITTLELDQLAADTIYAQGAQPSFKGYGGFAGHICISINEVVVHGIPGKRKIQSGDIVSIDVGAMVDGFHGDAADTFPVGDVDAKLIDLIIATRESFYAGIQFARPPYRLSDISHAIGSYAEARGYSVVRSMCGHGIGRDLHEDPEIPNFGKPGHGPRLKPGMALAIEPMINLGDWPIYILHDGWTAVTKDGLPSAHYENTLVITQGEPEILTCWP